MREESHVVFDRRRKFCRPAAAIIFAVCLAGSVAGAEQPFQLTVPHRNFAIVHTPEALAVSCGTSSHIAACTVFAGRRLECRCELRDGQWGIHARAQFIPNIILWHTAAMQHEIMHVEEVTRAASDHLAALTSLRFDSAEECLEHARVAADSFPTAMDTFQRESNLRHHPYYAPEPPIRQH